MVITRQSIRQGHNKATVAFKKTRPGVYQVHESDADKRIVNGILAIFMSSVVGNIINLDNVKMLTTKALIKVGIDPSRITTVEYNDEVFKEMDRSLGSNIVPGKVEEYISDTPVKKIGGVYFDFTGNSNSLKMFKTGIYALRKHETPEKIRIATTFSRGRGGMMSELELYNECLDTMKTSFPSYYVVPKWSYTYKRVRSGLTMYHRQYILQKK
jgi:hypothetical protein